MDCVRRSLPALILLIACGGVKVSSPEKFGNPDVVHENTRAVKSQITIMKLASASAPVRDETMQLSRKKMNLDVELPGGGKLSLSCEDAPITEPIPCKPIPDPPKSFWEILSEFAKPIAAALGGAIAGWLGPRLLKKRRKK